MGSPPLLHIILTLTILHLAHHHHTLALTTPSPTQTPTPQPTTKPTTTPKPTSTTLDPKQLRALQSLNLPTTKDPCSPTQNSTTTCDSSKPFRHLTSLTLTNCSDTLSLSTTALKSLSTLTSLTFLNCPAATSRFPTELSINLRTFTCIDSLKKITGVFLGRLVNVTDLVVQSVPVKASGLYVIIGNLRILQKLTISHANLTGSLPKSWHRNISYIDLSYNQLKGKIPNSITEMENLVYLDFSGNLLTGEMPNSIGDLIGLRNLSLSSNSLSGSIPDSLSSMPELEHIDLSSNQFNGTIPKFLNELKGLKHLNLERNNFQGVMPFNGSFIKRLAVFKIGENANLCYNHTTFSSKVKLGISPCDKNGLPMSPPASPSPSSGDGGDDASDGDDGSSQDETSEKSRGGHGPNKVVLGIAIALSSIVFLIIFLICLSRRCV